MIGRRFVSSAVPAVFLAVAIVLVPESAHAGSCGRTHGIVDIGIGIDGALKVSENPVEGSFRTGDYTRFFRSWDGGYTWVVEDWKWSHREQVVWGGTSVDTPRGTYYISDSQESRRSVNKSREAVYRTTYLVEPSNRRQQAFATRDMTAKQFSLGFPLSIAYDEISGNVVATMGFDGVVVGDPSGNWHRVAVDRFYPKDFSVAGRLRDVFGEPTLWMAALALSTTSVAVALLLSQATQPMGWASRTAIAVVVASPSVLSVMLLFFPYPNEPCPDFKAVTDTQMASAGLGLLFGGLTIAWHYWQMSWRILNLRVTVGAFVGIVGLFVMTFIIGAIPFHIEAAKLYVFPLLGLAMIWLCWWLRTADSK